MSGDDSSSHLELINRIKRAIGEAPPDSADGTTKESPRKDESKYAGLRDLAPQKETWSNYLRWILIISFGLQVALLVGVLLGLEVDEWTIRGVLLQFTAMFIAALRYLFK